MARKVLLLRTSELGGGQVAVEMSRKVRRLVSGHCTPGSAGMGKRGALRSGSSRGA